jgi:hypothetical protein
MMSQFEYLSVLISILIALGITEVTISWGRLLQHRSRVRFSGLHVFWATFLLFIMVQFWWGFWSYRTVDDWSLASLLIFVSEGIALVLCAIVLSPDRVTSGDIDLGDLYYENARPFFLLAAVFLALSTVGDTFVLGVPFVHTENVIRLVGIGLVTFVALSTDRRVHIGLPIVSVVLMAFFLARAYTL